MKNSGDRALTILLIDDVQTLLTVLKSGLEKLGWTVFTAASGEEGLNIFKSNPIDVVVCDLGMDGIDGLQVSQAIGEICHERGTPKAPFILLTGWSAGGEQDRAEEAAVSLVLEKPIEIKDLVSACRELTQ